MLYIFCAGSYSTEIHDLAARLDFALDQIVYIDEYPYLNNNIYPHKIISLSKLEELWTADDKIIIANGDPRIKSEIYQKLANLNINLTSMIDPTAIISPSARLGLGLIAMPYCSLSSFVRISNNVTINFNSNIGHHTQIGENSFISSMVNIGGNVTIGDNVFIGMGSMIKEGISIGDSAIISMGSFVHKDIPASFVAMGNPARLYLKNEKNKIFRRSSKEN